MRDVISFRLDFDPPTVTAQEQKVQVVNGKPKIYFPKNLRAARDLYINSLKKHSPKEPLEGPIKLIVGWEFQSTKSHPSGSWRTTKPDTDNLQKLLRDCMTFTGFWIDDSQVVLEIVGKRWSDNPGICIKVVPL